MSPYTLGLTLLEIMYVRKPPILPNFRAELLTGFNDQKFLSSLHVLSQVQKKLWPQLCAVCDKAPSSCAPQVQSRDLVIITDL